MTTLGKWLPALGTIVVLCGGLQAETVNKAPIRELDPAALATRIDELIEAKWKERGVQHAPLADDGEFLRRLYLDLAGRIPRVSEVRDFMADPSPNKRARLVETLLDNPRYVMHMSNTWRQVILPSSNDQQFQFFQPAFKGWLDKQVQGNVPYDQMVRELLSVPVFNQQFGRGGGIQPVNFNQSNPLAFYQANEFKAENLAAATTRVFLGVRLECAQCHDHPFAKWTKKQFWEYAAFFSGVRQQQFRPGVPAQPVQKLVNGREIAMPGKMPGTEKIVQARFLDGKAPEWQDAVDSRVTLADWFTSADNPYFAQTAANRMWAHFFGMGINDPVDDEATEENPVSHPELLNELTRQFVAHKFDMKYLMRAITLSKSYQRTSVVSHPSQNEPRLFARMAVKGLSPEQLFDSLALATGYQEQQQFGNQRVVFINGQQGARAEFLQRFATQDKKTETQTSILQALAMMNGKFIADATSVERSNMLAAVLDSPFMNNAQRIEALYLATLTRLPRPDEAERLLTYVNGGGPRNDPRSAMSDVLWVLLNSSEFMLNH